MKIQMNDAASAISLDDKYDLDKSRVFITGTQAIVRLLLTQHERDRRAGPRGSLSDIVPPRR